MKKIALLPLLLFTLACEKEKNQTPKKVGDLAVVTSTIASSLPEKTAIFRFQTEFCDNKGYYDPKLYTEKQLQDAFLLYQDSGILLRVKTVFNLEDLKYVRQNRIQILQKLETDFQTQKKKLQSLNTKKMPFWENVRKERMLELEMEYQFNKTQINAYNDPGILKASPFSENCKKYAEAVSADEKTLLTVWKNFYESQSQSNSDPQGSLSRLETQYSSADAKDYALIDLITFAWGNCANHTLKRVSHDEKMDHEFGKLFSKIEYNCDEP